MMARVDQEARICGLTAVSAENDFFELTVLPEVGGKIYDLIWKSSGEQLLWHNPRIRPQPYPVDTNFDNYWCGGWDEGFPTCDPCEHKGESFPNLGELRSVHWSVEEAGVRQGVAVVRLSAYGPISPVRAEKTILIDRDVVAVSSRITNIGPAPLDFIWGSHPALAITPSTVFRLPAKTGVVGLSSDRQLGSPGQRYTWPFLKTSEGTTDMSRALPFKASVFCGHYATDLEDGWYAAEDGETANGVLFRFPLDSCPYLWMWLVYGGWRGYYHAIIEPWTSCPVHLAEAVRQGTGRTLDPGAIFSVTIHVVPYSAPETWRDALAKTNATHSVMDRRDS